MNRNQKAFKKKHKSLEIPFKTVYYLDNQNDEQSPLVIFTAVDRLFMKTFIGLCLGASTPQTDEDLVTDLGLTCFLWSFGS